MKSENLRRHCYKVGYDIGYNGEELPNSMSRDPDYRMGWDDGKEAAFCDYLQDVHKEESEYEDNDP